MTRVDADENGPVRCAFISPGPGAAETFALVTGLSVREASELIDDHIVRGEN